MSEPALNALKLLQMFYAGCEGPVNGIEVASLGLAVEATEFPLVCTVRAKLSEMSNKDDNATTLPPGIVVACELACRWPMVRQRHRYINRTH